MHKFFQLLLGLSLSVSILMVLPTSANEVVDSKVALANALEKHKGEVIYLDFWASWCGPCRKSFPWMNSIQEKYNNQGFVVISVNLDAEHELAKEFLQQNPASFSVIYDPKGKLARQFKVQGMPSSMLFNRAGEITYRHTGFFIKKIPAYEIEISSLLKESK